MLALIKALILAVLFAHTYELAVFVLLVYTCVLFYVCVVRPFRKVRYTMQSPYSGLYRDWPMEKRLAR